MAVEFKAGLKDVIAVNSAICTVDGEQGLLRYRGYDIRDLATQATYEEVAYLLWHGELPTRAQLDDFTRALAAARALPEPVLDAMRTFPRAAHPLDVLRTTVSVAGMYDPEAGDNSEEATRRKALRLTAQIPVMVGTWHRLRAGQPPVAPRAEGGTAEDFLYVMTGRPPTPTAVRTMDMIFVLHADHEINASTFATRVAVATFTDLHAAITAALATLKGPRHGGANEDVLEMLLAIGAPGRAQDEIEARWARRSRMSREERAKPENRIPGFGHAVYKVDDPRAGVLREMARQLSQEAGTTPLFETALRVYETMHRISDLPVNVDFFSAVVYHALGIPIELCTSIFAAARISGWCAHALEQYHDRLIRPRAHYVGPAPRAFVPLAARS
ncbi:MAG TPA: citrate/2-methylcitrate synthase [bacterium]|nr:citrate/2-methylcitrate synthase [bacterium]